MTAHEMLGLDPTWVLSDDQAAQPLVAPLHAAPLEPTVGTLQHGHLLEGPSTLALAIVGVGALAIFRGLQKQLTPAVAEPVRQLIKPRRRAA
jgi:hypothetical protein